MSDAFFLDYEDLGLPADTKCDQVLFCASAKPLSVIVSLKPVLAKDLDREGPSQSLELFSKKTTESNTTKDEMHTKTCLTSLVVLPLNPGTRLKCLLFAGNAVLVFCEEWCCAFDVNAPYDKLFQTQFTDGKVTCCVVPRESTHDKKHFFLTANEHGCVTWWSGPQRMHRVMRPAGVWSLACDMDASRLVVCRPTTFDVLGLFNGKVLASEIAHKAGESGAPAAEGANTMAAYSGLLVMYAAKALRWTSLTSGAQSIVVGMGTKVVIGIHSLGAHVLVFYHCPSRGFSTILYSKTGLRIIETVLPVGHTECGDKIEMSSKNANGSVSGNYFLGSFVPNRLYIASVGLHVWSTSVHRSLPKYATDTVRMLMFHLVYKRRFLIFDNFVNVMEFMFWNGMPDAVEEWLRPVIGIGIMDMTFALASNLHWKSSDDMNPVSVVDAPGLFVSKETLNTEGPVQYVVKVKGTTEIGISDGRNNFLGLSQNLLSHIGDAESVIVNIHWSRGRLTLTDIQHKIRWAGNFPFGKGLYYASCRLGYNSSCELRQTLNDVYADFMPCSCGKMGEHVVDGSADCFCLCGRIGTHVMQYITDPKCGTRGSCICGEEKKHLATNLCSCECGRAGIHVLKITCAKPVESCICGVPTYHTIRDKCECTCGLKGIHAIRKLTCGLIKWSVETHHTRPWPQLFFRIVTTTLHCWNVAALPADTATSILEFFPWYTVDTGFRAPYFGSCLCRRVSIIANKDPVHAFYDHHRAVQRLHGAPFVLRYVFRNEDIAFHEGEKSSKAMPWKFGGGDNIVCPHCRVSLFVRTQNVTFSTSAIFSFPSKYIPNSFKPKAHLSYEHAILRVEDTLPKTDNGTTECAPHAEEEGIDRGVGGHCACGRIQLRVFTINSSILLRTTYMQRTTGSPLSWMLVVPQGLKHLAWDIQRGAVLSASTADPVRMTCSHCGSLMAVAPSRRVLYVPMSLMCGGTAHRASLVPRLIMHNLEQAQGVLCAHTTGTSLDLTKTDFSLGGDFAKTESNMQLPPAFQHMLPGGGAALPRAMLPKTVHASSGDDFEGESDSEWDEEGEENDEEGEEDYSEEDT